MKPNGVIKLLNAQLDAAEKGLPTTPLLFEGPPGVGKTAMQDAVTAARSWNYIDIRGSQKEPTDLHMQMPNVKTKSLICCVAGWVRNMPKRSVLGLDELGQTDKSVQKAFYRLVNERRLGEYPDVVSLPKDCVIWATTNRVGDRAGAVRLFTAMNNRFMIIKVEHDLKQWIGYATEKALNPLVIGYHQANMSIGKDMLMVFDPESDEMSFPSPRSWEGVARTLNYIPDESLNGDSFLGECVSGHIGVDGAGDFLAWMRLREKLPDIKKVIKDPGSAPVPAEPMVAYLLCSHLLAEARRNGSVAEPIAKYALRLGGDFTFLVLPDLVNSHADLYENADVQDWWMANKEAIPYDCINKGAA